MKKNIIGMTLTLFPLFALSETVIVSEILIGKSQHEIKSYLNPEVSDESYSASLNDNSFGFRLGVKFWDNVSIELAKHDHGSAVNEFTVYYPTSMPGTPSGGNCCLGPDHDYTAEAIIPVEIDSIRFGIKGEIELVTNFTINARIGLAHWSYKNYTPKKLANFSPLPASDESGIDLYYSLGAEYKVSENLYIGIEYSLLTVNESYAVNDVSGSYSHDVKDLSIVAGWVF
jgi:opacity protein-like surface antigen